MIKLSRVKSFLSIFIILTTFVSCASSNGIFPTVVTSTNESLVVLPNPISIAVDEANSQIIVANSNVDIFFDQGSIAVLTVDASTVSNPQLTASEIIAAPNFAGRIHLDTTSGALYTSFRESFATDDSKDTLSKYTVTAGNIDFVSNTSVSADPFGITLYNSTLYVVSDDYLSTFDTSLTALSRTDLTTAEDASLDNSDATYVENIAIDATNNRAFITNVGGRIFVINLTTALLEQVIAGPESSRDILVDSNLLYVTDSYAGAVWVFDLTDLSAAASVPEEVDDSEFLIKTIGVGTTPTGMALDTTNNRLYVANSSSNDISVIDTNTLEEIARISVDEEDLTNFSRGIDQPFALALGTFNSQQYLFVVGYGSNSIAMIRTNTLTVASMYPSNSL